MKGPQCACLKGRICVVGAAEKTSWKIRADYSPQMSKYVLRIYLLSGFQVKPWGQNNRINRPKGLFMCIFIHWAVMFLFVCRVEQLMSLIRRNNKPGSFLWMIEQQQHTSLPGDGASGAAFTCSLQLQDKRGGEEKKPQFWRANRRRFSGPDVPPFPQTP